MTRRVLIVGAVFACAVVTAGWITGRRRPVPAVPQTDAAIPGAFPRVTVEVLNGTRTAGLALAATLRLRHERLDVVYFGNADTGRGNHLHNTIFVRRGDTAGVGRALVALGSADVVSAPDTTRMVDLSVLLGSAFTTAAAAHH
jgi:hypothetical protein